MSDEERAAGIFELRAERLECAGDRSGRAFEEKGA